MQMITDEQKQAIETLQEAHGAILGMMKYLRDDAPPEILGRAKEVVDESILCTMFLRPLMYARNECEECGYCKFWYPRADRWEADGSPGVGWCHRYAPSPRFSKQTESVEEDVEWPITAANSECGDFVLSPVFGG